MTPKIKTTGRKDWMVADTRWTWCGMWSHQASANKPRWAGPIGCWYSSQRVIGPNHGRIGISEYGRRHSLRRIIDKPKRGKEIEMTAKLKTIKRRKAWPRSARYYAVDGLCRVPCTYRLRPSLGDHVWVPQSSNYRRDMNIVRGPRLDADWTLTLRRIVP